MHAIFDNNNSVVNRISDSIVNITFYDLILTHVVNNSPKTFMMTIGL